MSIAATILLPALVALALCVHLGVAWRQLLPPALQPYRWLLAPLLGFALLLIVVTPLTLLTALTPPQVVAGLTLAVAPLNLWTLLRRRAVPRLPAAERWAQAGCLLIAALVFALAVLPVARWGISTPIGSNWDPADVYIPLGRALELRSQRDVGQFPRNPLLKIIATPPVTGRVHSFSYLHATASRTTGVEPLHSFVPLLALLLALQPLAAYVLGRVGGLRPVGALFGAGLLAAAWLPLWVADNGFAEHLAALPLLPAALASGLAALRAGGRRALLTGAALIAGLACAYYPALSAFVALFAPAAGWLLWRPWVVDGGGARPCARARWSVAARLLALAALAFVLSLGAQALFFFADGFLDEIRRGNSGFQIGRFVPLTDIFGLGAHFRDRLAPLDARLAWPAAALALLLLGAGCAGRRAPALAAMLVGALVYLAAAALMRNHYAFYKGVTFFLPILALLTAAGADAAWRWVDDGRRTDAGRRLVIPMSPSHRVIVSSRHVVKGSGVLAAALILALSAHTAWRVQSNLAVGGPRLWSLRETRVAGVRAAVPDGASVLFVPSAEHPRTFGSLVSYALLGHELFGSFPTAYGGLSAPARQRAPALALLPDDADPAAHGFEAADARWAGAGLRLYGRDSDVRAHRVLGGGGRYPALAPGQELTLRLGAAWIALPGEDGPPADPAAPARLALAVASFAPARLEVAAGGQMARYDLPAGVAELRTRAGPLPGTVRLRNLGATPVYLWWGELRAPGSDQAPIPREVAFVQAMPDAAGRPGASDIRLHTLPLPTGRQKLTALLIASSLQGKRDWREIGRWLFFPQTETLRLETDLLAIAPALRRGGAPVELIGGGAPAGDGRYRLTLLLANDARIVFGTPLWEWEVRGGAVRGALADPVAFEVLPLPRPATPVGAIAEDGALRLAGYTLPGGVARPGEPLTLHLVWQALRRSGSDLRARLELRDAGGRVLVAASGPLGPPEHGTSTWLEGELSEQELVLDVPADARGAAALFVELRAPDGRPMPLGGSASYKLAEVRVE
jgi:hypothetical protein